MQQIRKVRADLGSFGCTTGSFVVLGGKNSKACAKLNAGQTKMRANLSGSRAQARFLFRTRQQGWPSAAFEAALKANDCDGRRAAPSGGSPQGPAGRRTPQEAGAAEPSLLL
jgi:hypothetical protein